MAEAALLWPQGEWIMGGQELKQAITHDCVLGFLYLQGYLDLPG